MFPVIIELGRYQLRSYSLTLLIAFVLGVYIAYRRGKKIGLPENTVIDYSMAIVLSGLIGSRILYVFTHIEEFRGRWLDTINPFGGENIGLSGLVFLGGLLCTLAVMSVMAWRRRESLLMLFDLFAPSLALGAGIGRIGCFLNGCCFGHPTDLPWGIVFPAGCLAAWVYPGEHIQPTQLYEVIYNFALFGMLFWAEGRYKRFHGFTSAIFFVVYGIFRLLNETLRWYEQSMHFIEYDGRFITLSQLISLSMIIGGIIYYMYARRRALRKSEVSALGS